MKTLCKHCPTGALVRLLLFTLVLSACSDSSNGPSTPQPLPINLPTVSSPPAEGQPALLSTTFPLEDVGYRQQEFFLTGTATAYTNLDELNEDGTWLVEPGESASYSTRVLVYLPQDMAAFSGSVFVEWLNVTTGFELPVSYGTAHTELLDAGHAIVLLSAQFAGVEGAENPLLPLHLKAVNPQRYGSLHHPGDSFSYDMLTQVAGVLREGGQENLLGGLQVTHLFAMGQSQSASYLVSYYNAIQPLYQAYNGFLIQNRGGGAAPLSQAPQVFIDAPEVTRLSTGVDALVINVQGETDVLALGSVSARQNDNSRLRLWEVAGTAHNDEYTFVSGRNDIGDDPAFALVVEQTSILGFQQCALPMNSGYLAWPVNAAVRGLDQWARSGEAPAEVARLNLSDDQQAFILDDVGNVTGGLRTSYVDAPAAILSGLGQVENSFCRLFGTTELFDAASMASRYTDKDGYIEAVRKAVQRGIEQRTLLPRDSERVIDAAGLQWDRL